MIYKLQDLIDIGHFQYLQDRLNEIYTFPASIIDNDGNILTATAWQDICSNFHRKNKKSEQVCIKSDQYILRHLHEANPAVSYHCPHGLVDCATPIIIDGIHYGNFFTGQFFLEEPDLDFFRGQAQKYGFDEKSYIEAVKKVPIWTQKQLDNYILFIKGLIDIIAESGLKRIKEIEHRKKIEISEKRLRSILKTAIDGFCLADMDGRLLEVNDAYCRMTGYSEKELLSMHVDDLEAAEDVHQIVEHRKKLFEKGSDRFESKHRRKDGTIFDVEISVQFRFDEKGRFVAFVRDITERKKAEEFLQKSEEKLRAIFNASPMAIVLLDREGRILDSNEVHANRLEKKREEILDKCIWDLLPESVREHRKRQVQRVFDTGRPVQGEDQREQVWNEYYIHPSMTDHNGCVQAVIVEAINITDRKQAELALRESEQIFRNFSEQSFVGFYIIQDDIFKYVNPKFAEIFGYSVDECLDNMTFRRLVHPEDLAAVQEQVKKRIDGQIETVQHTFRGIQKNGSIIHVAIYGSSLIYKERPAAIGTMLDITREMKMKKHAAQAQRVEAIGTLAGGIAHDFNNILFPIVGLSEMLLEDLAPDSPEHESVVEILRAGRRGSELVQQILAFSRQSEQKKGPIRIQKILKEVMKLSRSTIPANIPITQDIQSDCSLVSADATQMHQIVMNLITNAYHAVEPNSGKIVIQLREISIGPDELPDSNLLPGRYVLLSVSDTGVGIDPVVQDKIFEPYFTTKEQGKGTGLGLAVVYGIVKEHLGDIKVYSEPGKGTTFKIYLPVMAKSEESVSIEKVKDDPKGDERILLVDDEEPIANLEKQMLERLGYQVTMRFNSLEALEAFKARPTSFDLVISDMTMPGMTGDQLAQALMGIRPDIPIIICTGFSERLNPEKAADIGIKGFLMKPIVKADMAKMVRNVLDGSACSAQG